MSATRRAVLAGVLTVLVGPERTFAQAPPRIPRIGYLGMNRPQDVPHLVEALRRGLRDHGWIEGHTIHIEYRWAEGVASRLPRLADELVRQDVVLLVVPVTQAIQAAKNATRTIPIVMVAANDPMADGFVNNFGRPGGIITGLSFDPGPELSSKQVDLLVHAIPHLSRLAVLVNPTNATHGRMTESTRGAARALNLHVDFVDIPSPREMPAALDTALKRSPGAVLVHSDGMLFSSRNHIVELAAKHRLATMFPWREAAEAGGLLAYGANLSENFRRAASFVDRLLRGAKAADLPVERPTKFELVVNLKTAKALGLTIPPSLLLRADQVIE